MTRMIPQKKPKQPKGAPHPKRSSGSAAHQACGFVHWVRKDEQAIYLALHALVLVYQAHLAEGGIESWAAATDAAQKLMREAAWQTLVQEVERQRQSVDLREDAADLLAADMLDDLTAEATQGALLVLSRLQERGRRDAAALAWDAIDQRGDLTYAAANLAGGIIARIVRAIVQGLARLLKESVGGGGGGGGGLGDQAAQYQGVYETEGDGKVCQDCRALDGKKFSAAEMAKLGRQDIPPIHPNCRCRIRVEKI